MKSLLLIGPRGSGKSSVGVLLAGKLGMPFLNLDDIVLESFDEDSVTEVWKTQGEPAWREAEVNALKKTLGEKESVIALGGGVPMIEDARTLINHARDTGAGKVVYLRCEPSELRRRLEAEPGDRPGLIGDDPIAEIQEVLALREPTYTQLADHVFDVSTATEEKIAADLAEWVRSV